MNILKALRGTVRIPANLEPQQNNVLYSQVSKCCNMQKHADDIASKERHKMGASFSAEQILDATQGRIAVGFIDDQKGRLVWDLDDVRHGDWFLALSSGYHDAHDSLSTAFELGAHGCIVNRRSRYSFAPKDRTLISVLDTKVALLQLMSLWRHEVHPITVGVVGSTGRRATIKLLHHLLQGSFKCHIAFDSGGSCARDVLLMPESTEVLLFEAGAVERGDVARIGAALNPNVGVIVRTQHPLPSPERDARTAALYCEILETVDRYNPGMAVVYDANPAVRELARQLLPGLVSTTYSQTAGRVQELSPPKLELLIKSLEIEEEQSVTAAEVWCAVETARALGLSFDQMEAAIENAVAFT